ncbi:carboxylesterase/lipase family protein [Microbacterium sp. NPDC091313]
MSEIVRTTQGEVRGVRVGDTWRYLGIPYAQAPVGALRFAAPVPPEPWEGMRDATAYGPTPQRGDTGITLIPEPSIPGDDTLAVNVFTPGTAGSLPVLVYIHGGGYTSGSPASPWYDGAAFARDGVVTVTLSYRLGFDGFGWIEDAPSNRGLRDQLAALAWVQREIAAFGGDPTRVTIAGQSAGGAAVLTLLGLPAAAGLFSGVLAISPAITDVAADRTRQLAVRLARLAGVPATRAGFASVGEERLLALQKQAERPETADRLGALADLLEGGLPWGPMIDGDLVPEGTVAAIRAGRGAGVPLMLGSTDDEFTMSTDRLRRPLALVPAGFALGRLRMPRAQRRAYLADNRAQRRRGTAAMLGRYASDRIFRSGVAEVAAARGAAPTWMYRFSWRSPVIGWACHCLDVPFWFDVLDAPGVREIAGDAPPRGLADDLHAAAVQLVREGDPGWAAWSQHPGTTRVFGGDASAPDVVADGYASVRALL